MVIRCTNHCLSRYVERLRRFDLSESLLRSRPVPAAKVRATQMKYHGRAGRPTPALRYLYDDESHALYLVLPGDRDPAELVAVTVFRLKL